MIILSMIAGCSLAQESNVQSDADIKPLSSPTFVPSETLEPVEGPTETKVPTISVPTRPTDIPSVTPSSTVTLSSEEQPNRMSEAIIVDHTSVELFNQIPPEYIKAASELRMLFLHASVGYNIDMGLNCLMDREKPRPNGCDKGISADEVVYGEQYDRTNWVFEFYQPPPAQNPGWYNKVGIFVERVDSFGEDEFDVAGFKMGYVDAYPGSELDNVFFQREDRTFPTIGWLEGLESRHPSLVIVYWTLGLARMSDSESENFNQLLRQYVVQNGKILMDIADIESHRPDGTKCFSNLNNNVEAICQDYTNEENAGHLNPFGRQQIAKAIWVLMARIAGWDGKPIQ